MITAIISGILLAFSFPTRIGEFTLLWWPLAWFALIPVYSSLTEVFPLRTAVRMGYLVGLFYYGISLYWIFIALHVYGGVSTVVSLFAVVLLVSILALYLGGAFALAVFLARRGLPLAAGLPLAWVLQDWLRNLFPLGGFSWSSLAYSQGEFLTLLQIADITGPYGITLLILIANALMGEGVLFLQKKRRFPLTFGFLFLFLMGGTLLYGHYRKDQVLKGFQELPSKEIAFIQGNVAQEEKWMEENIEMLIDHHLSLSKEAEKKYRPDLILWPEAAYPAVIPPGLTQLEVLRGLKSPLLIGSVTYQGILPDEWPPPRGSDFRLFNSAVLVLPGGEIGGVYHKNHLVPVGEYIPFEKLLFFVKKVVPGYASFSPGEDFPLLQANGLEIGTTICFEDLFPEISRAFVRKGANLLVNLTNDAWYEKSSALLQHVEFSRLRAIENRRYLARATNTGVTAVFDPIGQEVARAPLFEESILSASVRLGGPMTFYTRFEDVFVWVCLFVLVASAVLTSRGSFKG